MKIKFYSLLFFSLFLLQLPLLAERVLVPGQIVQVQPGEPAPQPALGQIIEVSPTTQSIQAVQSPQIANDENMVAMPSATPCQCYCSDLCGPRDMKEDDKPFVDAETGVCFCQQRDKDNYIPNGCNVKNPNPVIENSCCNIR